MTTKKPKTLVKKEVRRLKHLAGDLCYVHADIENARATLVAGIPHLMEDPSLRVLVGNLAVMDMQIHMLEDAIHGFVARVESQS